MYQDPPRSIRKSRHHPPPSPLSFVTLQVVGAPDARERLRRAFAIILRSADRPKQPQQVGSLDDELSADITRKHDAGDDRSTTPNLKEDD